MQACVGLFDSQVVLLNIFNTRGFSCPLSKRYLPDVTLTDQHTSVMDGLGQSKLEHLCLQTTLQEILNLQTEHVIELHAGLIQDTNAHQTTQQSVTYGGETGEDDKMSLFNSTVSWIDES